MFRGPSHALDPLGVRGCAVDGDVDDVVEDDAQIGDMPGQGGNPWECLRADQEIKG